MKTKLILLDMDGTLLNSKGEMSDRTKSAIKGAIDKGIMVAVASGRIHNSLMPYIRMLNIKEIAVSCNGAMIKDLKSNEVIYENAIPLNLAKKVLHYIDSMGKYCQYYTDETYYFKEHRDINEWYNRLTGIRGIAQGSRLYDKITELPLKILMIEEDSDELDGFDRLTKEFGDKLEITSSGHKFIEIMKKGVNKGTALIKLCEIYNIKIENTIAIGDGQNDIEMIQNAGLGVAVASGHEKLLQKADIICDSADDDGPAKFIEEYILKNN